MVDVFIYEAKTMKREQDDCRCYDDCIMVEVQETYLNYLFLFGENLGSCDGNDSFLQLGQKNWRVSVKKRYPRANLITPGKYLQITCFGLLQ
jgi:hypothetical protein